MEMLRDHHRGRLAAKTTKAEAPFVLLSVIRPGSRSNPEVPSTSFALGSPRDRILLILNSMVAGHGIHISRVVQSSR